MKKRRILPIALSAMLLSVGMIGCGAEDEKKSDDTTQKVEEKQISITAAKKRITKGDTLQLTSSEEGVTWSVDKTDIATIDANGLLTGVGKGIVTITAKKEGCKEATTRITVDLEKITITAAGGKGEVVEDATLQLTASKDAVTWSSSNNAVATVSAAGLVTGVKNGTVTISAVKDGFETGTISITVKRPAPIGQLHMEDAEHYSADGWWGSGSSGPGATPVYDRNSGNASDAKCIAYFGEGDKETLTFTSSAAVSAEVVIMMASSNSFDDLSTAMSVKLNNNAVSISGKALNTSSSSEFIEFSLGNLNIVNGDNVLELTMLGSAPYLDDVLIYSKQQATIAVKAAAAKDTITVENNTVSVEVGKTATINVTHGEGVTFVSENTEVATVDNTGVITGATLGSTGIIVKKDGMYSARVAISVTEALLPGEIRLEAEKAEEAIASQTGFMVLSDTTSGITRAHSGGGYLSGYNVTGDETLTFNFTSSEAKFMKLVVVGSAAYGSTEDFVFADSTTIKMNDTEVTIDAEGKIEAGNGSMSAARQESDLGNVTIIVGNNVLTITFHGKAPSLDCFRLLPIVI